MLPYFRRCFTITLLCLCSTAAFAQPADQDSPLPLIEELLTAEIAQVQEKGETQLSFSLEQHTGALEIEFGLTSRLQLAVELPFENELTLDADDLEVGLGYRLFSTGRSTVVAAIGVSPTSGSGVYATLVAGTAVGKGQIHSALTHEREENDGSVQVAAVYPFGRWRALLEASGQVRESTRQITPAIAWQNESVGLVAGVTLGRGAKPGVLLKATFEF